MTVVVAAAGYPADAAHGRRRSLGADRVPGVLHAGTARRADGSLVSAGGRVLCCTATGPDLASARHAAYALVDGVTMAGAQFRPDIALTRGTGRLNQALRSGDRHGRVPDRAVDAEHEQFHDAVVRRPCSAARTPARRAAPSPATGRRGTSG